VGAEGFSLSPTTRAGRTKYKSTPEQRRVRSASWDEISTYLAKGASWPSPRPTAAMRGGGRLIDQDGYDPECWSTGEERAPDHEVPGGMGLRGVIGKYGLYRISNLMALLDSPHPWSGPR
jgi:nitrate reductase alpha subunit